MRPGQSEVADTLELAGLGHLNSALDDLSSPVDTAGRTSCPRPECGWSGPLDDCGVLGADDGFVFCRGCCGEFRPVFPPTQPTLF